MNFVKLAALLVILSAPAAAGPYSGSVISTTTGVQTDNLSGRLLVAASSKTPTAYTITLDGPSGGLNASSGTFVYGVKAATGVFTGSSFSVGGSTFVISSGGVTINRAGAPTVTPALTLQGSTGETSLYMAGGNGWGHRSLSNGNYELEDVSFPFPASGVAFTNSGGVSFGNQTVTANNVLLPHGSSFSNAPSGFGRLYNLSGSGTTMQGDATEGTYQASLLDKNGNYYGYLFDTNGNLHIAPSGTNTYMAELGGKVGIGTDSPSAILHVHQGTNQNFRIQAINSNLGFFAADDGGSAAPLDLTASVYRFNTGKVGIGGVPAVPLAVTCSSGDCIRTLDGTGTGAIQMASGVAQFGTAGNTAAQLITNNAARVTVDNVGLIGIGTTAPATKLHMSSGTLTIDGTGAAAVIRGSLSATTGVIGGLAVGDPAGSAAYGTAVISGENGGQALNDSLAVGDLPYANLYSLASGYHATAQNYSLAVGHTPTAQGNYSVALGFHPTANSNASFVWNGDAGSTTTSDSGAGSVKYRAPGGFTIELGSFTAAGTVLAGQAISTVTNCGNSVVTAGTGNAGVITVGSSPSTTCSITWTPAYPTGSVCFFSDVTRSTLANPTIAFGVSSATATFSGSLTAADKIAFICHGY